VEIYTTSFRMFQKERMPGIIPISIARSAPNTFYGQSYNQLFPTYDLLKDYKNEKINQKIYIQRYYNDVLNKLDIEEVIRWFECFELPLVLLCYETYPDFCHRYIVAEWLFEKANISCPEYVGNGMTTTDSYLKTIKLFRKSE
jgi:hypothetical protein